MREPAPWSPLVFCLFLGLLPSLVAPVFFPSWLSLVIFRSLYFSWVLFESIFAAAHPQFVNKHARSSCAFDTSTVLLDMRAWRKDEVPSRLLDLVGTSKRAEF